MKKTILTLSVAGLMVSGASAALLVNETFTYPDGSLVPNGGWANHSGTPGDLLLAGGKAVLQHGTPSEDANIQFTPQATGIITANFDIIVQDDTVIGGSDFEYFAHFFTDGSFNFRSRVDVQAPTGVGDYTLGISSISSTAEATLVQDFNFGDTVNVTLLFDVDSGVGSLTVGAETIVGTSSALGEIIDAFALRQSDSSNNETITIDNLVISNNAVPEPSSTALLGLGGLALLIRRKR